MELLLESIKMDWPVLLPILVCSILVLGVVISKWSFYQKNQRDITVYMRELQRRIKLNWNPPKGNESKRVVLLFKIAKDGRLLSCSVFKSSGLQNADKAALNAVHLAAPFRPLPPEYKGQSIDIQFTFDYNVFGATKY